MKSDVNGWNAGRLGLVGLGRMGLAILPRLLAAGPEITVWNRSSEKTHIAAEMGARVASSLQDLCDKSDVILTIVFDDAALKDVFLGPAGLLSSACGGKLFIDMSTVLPETARAIGQAAKVALASFVSAPVCGSVGPAKEGKLLVLAGGSPEDYERAKPVLSLFSRKVEHVGAVGSGSAMKLAVQLPISVYWQSLAEALSLGRESGLDLGQMLRLIADSPAALPALPSKIKTILLEDNDVSFDIQSAQKDASLMQREAQRLGVNLPTASSALKAFSAAMESGWSDRDIATIVNYVFCSGGHDSQR
ncbi:NAD(P)-dependent oxidoreductase [Bradyrhizobium canariense]|uniref:3-hydroxyisobutyrate dehydrogenase n=1 Tax=Bradyrhizobium canariense TaxID=255045 RepID=A0A1H1YND2_9BRAD|nr:NAD(P)-dependent oxidoreductase [Bradyrhizobium canariense]SDT22955.1 3-hydroxyisobutyrate dehydrogenase [Bradyrhizobium canariense]